MHVPPEAKTNLKHIYLANLAPESHRTEIMTLGYTFVIGKGFTLILV